VFLYKTQYLIAILSALLGLLLFYMVKLKGALRYFIITFVLIIFSVVVFSPIIVELLHSLANIIGDSNIQVKLKLIAFAEFFNSGVASGGIGSRFEKYSSIFSYFFQSPIVG